MALGLVPGGVGEAEAQISDVSRISLGDSVRIRLPGALRVDASLLSWRGDVMMLDLVGLDAPWPVSILELEALEVHVARTSREGFRYGAGVGAAAGIFLGAGLGLVLHATGIVNDPDQPQTQVMRTATRWSALGAVAGALGGGFYMGAHPGFGWVRIELPRS